MSAARKALQDFLDSHCEIKSLAPGKSSSKERCYILATEGCLLYMAENHLEEIRRAISQTEESIKLAKDSGDYSNVIMAYNWDAPSPGMDSIKIPFKVIESLDDKTAMIVLRNLEGIQKDIEEGQSRRSELQHLFGETASVKLNSNLDGERVYLIVSNVSASDTRRYAERYAEHIATSVLFDLPKALNAKLQTILPKESRGRYFLEGRDITAKKVRFGSNVSLELLLTEEGATIYSSFANKDSVLRNNISKVFHQAITDPFGFSLKYYMGKHALIKIKPKSE